jgi:hypothetical protein
MYSARLFISENKTFVHPEKIFEKIFSSFYMTFPALKCFVKPELEANPTTFPGS